MHAILAEQDSRLAHCLTTNQAQLYLQTAKIGHVLREHCSHTHTCQTPNRAAAHMLHHIGSPEP